MTGDQCSSARSDRSAACIVMYATGRQNVRICRDDVRSAMPYFASSELSVPK
jgi:hypothetical protein